MNPHKINSEDSKNINKKTFFQKIKSMAKKTKHILKNFFPRRIKPTDQEKNKGQKF